MTFHLPPRKRLTSSSRAFTFMELLIAMLIILIIMAGVTAAFVELLRSHDKARARTNATANARQAMETLSVEFKRARNTTGTQTFIGSTAPLATTGDSVDQDGDGNLDEEILNGLDDDGDWQAADDRHANLGSTATAIFERPVYYGVKDLDDAHIDQDLRFSSSTVEFDTFDVPGDPVDRRVKFYVGTDPDGNPHTLMKQVSGVDPVTSTPVVTAGPVCHNVLSFGLLFWDFARAKSRSDNPWQTSWPPSTPSQSASPSTVYMTVSVYSGTPLTQDEVTTGTPLETVTLTSEVNVESVLSSSNYITMRDQAATP